MRRTRVPVEKPLHVFVQERVAREVIQEMEQAKLWPSPIVTEVTPIDNYSVAEDYHQEYFANNPYQPYCMAIVAPKVLKFRKHFVDMLKKEPA